MIYGDKLKQLRERVGNTQEELSKIIGIERGLYSHYETEYTLMPIKHLNTICNFYGVSLDYILSLNNDLKYEKFNFEIDKTKTGTRLKEIRKDNKLTQVKLANILNVSQSAIAEFERGRNTLATPFLYTICKKYNISADYLLGKIEEPKYLNNP